MDDDAELLRRYLDEQSQAAFAEIVRRHLPTVYATALRQLRGDQHLAEEAAQVVFRDLALKAARLRGHPVLVGWLFTSTRYAASRIIQGESRRQRHERAAAEMNEILRDDAAVPDSDLMRPLVDDLLGELTAEDRETLLLRFFEHRSVREIGQRMRLTEEGARSRISRALDRLHGRFLQRGIRSSSEALAALLATQAGAAAPAHLAESLAAFALETPAFAGPAVATLLMTTTQKIFLGAALIAIIGFGAYEYQVRAQAEATAKKQLSDELASARRREATQRKELQDLRAAEQARVEADRATPPAPPSPPVAPTAAQETLAAVSAVMAAGANMAIRVLNSNGTASDEIVNFLHLTADEKAAFEKAIVDVQGQLLADFARRATVTSSDEYEVRITVPPLADGPGPYEALTEQLANLLGQDRTELLFAVGLKNLNAELHTFGKAETTFTVTRAPGNDPSRPPFMLVIANASHPGEKPGILGANDTAMYQIAGFNDPQVANYKWLNSYGIDLPALKSRDRVALPLAPMSYKGIGNQ